MQGMAWEDFRAAGLARDERAVLFPTFAQLRFMAFATIINGATGLLFSMHGVATADPVCPSLQRLLGELRGLATVLAAERGRAEERALRCAYENLGFSVWKGVQTAVKALPDGRRFLLAANASWDPANPTWSGLPLGVVALQPVVHSAGGGAARPPPIHVVQDASNTRVVSDRFEPFGVRVYELVTADGLGKL